MLVVGSALARASVARQSEWLTDSTIEKLVFTRPSDSAKPALPFGPVAQLIERVVRNDEVVGLIPIWSTSLRQAYGWQASSRISAGSTGRTDMKLQRRRLPRRRLCVGGLDVRTVTQCTTFTFSNR